MEAINQLELGRRHLRLRLLVRKKLRLVDLGKLLPLAGSRRPFERERVAPHRRRIAIALERPRVHDLPALVFDRAERSKVSARFDAGFLLELSLRSRKFIFARLDFSLRDEPGALVLSSPERTSQVDQQHLELIVTDPVHQQACAVLRHRAMFELMRSGRRLAQAASFSTLRALSRRNFGQTWSLNGTDFMSVIIRSSDRPI